MTEKTRNDSSDFLMVPIGDQARSIELFEQAESMYEMGGNPAELRQILMKSYELLFPSQSPEVMNEIVNKTMAEVFFTLPE